MNHFVGAGSAGARYAHTVAQSSATSTDAPMYDPTNAETNVIVLTLVVIFSALIYLFVCFLNVYFYIVVYSYYDELTKLEDKGQEHVAEEEKPVADEEVDKGDA